MNLEEIQALDLTPKPKMHSRPKTRKVKLGDVLALGTHYLYCGEKITSFLCLDRMKVCIASPRMKHLDEDLDLIRDSVRNGTSYYVWYDPLYVSDFAIKMKENGLPIKQEIVWIRTTPIINKLGYTNIFSPCAYGWMGDRYFENRDTLNVLESSLDFQKMTKTKLQRYIYNVFTTPMDAFEEETQIDDKPNLLIEKFIVNSSKKYDKVCDLFSGDGKVMMACEFHHRHCFTVERNPEKAEKIVKMWAKKTGKKPRIVRNIGG